MTEERDAKRSRLDDKDNDKAVVDNDNDTLQSLLDGDHFVSAAEREAVEAERRRAQRRERLRRIALQVEGDEREGGDFPLENRTAASVVDPAEKEQTNQTAISHRGEDKSAGTANPVDGKDATEDSGTESFDMFSATPPPPLPAVSRALKSTEPKDHEKMPSTHTVAASQRGQEQQDFDDEEGYYNAVIGETIELHVHSQTTSGTVEPIRLRVDGLIGRGVFSTVLKVTTISNSSSHAIPPTAAVKMIRSNETMAKAALNEIRFLHQLRGSRGIVPLLLPTTVNPMEHRGHVMLVFPHLEYNMRDVLQKFGKGVGLSLSAVRSYFGQLVSALTHLKRRGIIHADLKPDNLLIDADFTTVHLADFGSAFEANSSENQPTPYMVSRFYRAPEIILGLTPSIAIDLWSLAVSVAELFLGNVLFRGKSNNDMLYVFMQHLGAFSNRIVRQHIVQLSRIPSLARQFQANGANYVFLQQTVDSVTGVSIHNKLPLVSVSSSHESANSHKFPLATPLSQKILRAKSANDSRTQVLQFVDLLQKCLALDPGRRISLKDALGHGFFRIPEASSSSK